jgi:hypothetical protein
LRSAGELSIDGNGIRGGDSAARIRKAHLLINEYFSGVEDWHKAGV